MTRAWKIRALVLIAVVAVGGAIRSWDLGEREITDDEAFSWRVIAYPVPEMLERLTEDVHPPLYYLALRCWTAVSGDSLAGLRSLSVVFGCATLVGVYGFVRQLVLAFGGRWPGLAGRAAWAGLVAAVLVAVEPSQVAFGRAARMYAMGGCLAAFSSWLLIAALSRRPGGRWWWAYALVAAAFAYTHYFAVFTLAVHAACALAAVAVAFSRGKRDGLATAGDVGLAAVVFLMCYSPWLPSLWVQVASVREGFWTQPLGTARVHSLLFAFLCGFQGGDKLVQGGVVAAGLAALLALPFARGRAGVLLLLLVASPWIGAVGVSLLSGRSIVLGRYLLFAQLFYLCALAVLAAGVKNRAVRLTLAALLVADFAAATGLELGLWRPRVRHIEQMARRIGGPRTGVRLVLASDAGSANQVLYYLTQFGQSCRVRVIGSPPSGGGHRPHVASIAREDWIPTEDLRRLEYPRFWTVGRSPVPVAPWPSNWLSLSSELFTNGGTILYLTEWEYSSDGF